MTEKATTPEDNVELLRGMLEDIDNLVSNDFCHDMQAKLIPYFTLGNTEEVFSQEDAACMSQLLGEVYAIAHATHCEPCMEKYISTNE